VGFTGDSSAFGWYHYAANNPYRDTDPSGEVPVETIFDALSVTDDIGKISVRYATNNPETMQNGLAPLGPDGKSINLHHMTQGQNGAIAEVTQTCHQQNSKTIHINPNATPSGIDRDAFNKWRSDYWRSRACDFE